MDYTKKEVGRKELENRRRERERESKSVCVCMGFPSGSLVPTAGILICRWSEGWKGRTEQEEGGIDGRREAMVTPRRSSRHCSGLLEIAQRREERGRERDKDERGMRGM